jgi:hypothetical protein
MMTKMIAPIALALILGALPAGAGSRHHERGNGEAEKLSYRADRFLEQVVRHGIHHPGTRHGFEQLERAFVTAEVRRSGLQRARRLRDEFERVEHPIRGLDRRLANRTNDGRPRRHAVARPKVRHNWVSFRFSY